MKRYHQLDYLRGIAAFSVMYYHFTTWTYGVYSSQSLMGKVGLYAVSVFYVLSGLTLFLVYEERQNKFIPFIKDFFVKRAFRIMPLLWLTIIATLIVKEQIPDKIILFLNLTGLFGIIDCNISIARGGWSIGNELAFYLFFPVFLFLAKYLKNLFYCFSCIIILIFLWFGIYYLDNNSTIVNEWFKYINPLNQVALFLAGFLIGYFKIPNVNLNKNLLLLIASFLAFAWYPVSGDRITLITDSNRVIFSVLCVIICFSVYRLNFEFPLILHKPLSFLGEISYSLYLIHPIIWALVEKTRVIHRVGGDFLYVLVSISITLIVSFLVFTYFEKFFIKKGKELLKSPLLN